MTTIVDRRGNNKNKLAGSRAKFIDRHKHEIKEKITEHLKNSKLKNVNEDIKINIPKTREVRARYSKKGNHKAVHPGNKSFDKGDKIHLPPEGGKGSSAGNSNEITEDDFEFILTKEEYMDLLFNDLELPNFLKKSNKLMQNTKLVSGGYIKDGIPARLAIKKTLENSYMRRAASGKDRDKTRFIDDIDLRYRNLIPQPQPVSHAVIFMVMDVSGSMSEFRKLLAKKFFLLFYLFLNKNYTHLDIRFISHTTIAQEVSETDFFYSKESGGTCVSPAFELVNKIIDKEYDISDTNIYIAQASDGDNWPEDEKYLQAEVIKLLPKIQYFSYIEVDNSYPESGVAAFYEKYFSDEEKLVSVFVTEDSDILNSLYKLFGTYSK